MIHIFDSGELRGAAAGLEEGERSPGTRLQERRTDDEGCCGQSGNYYNL